MIEIVEEVAITMNYRVGAHLVMIKHDMNLGNLGTMNNQKISLINLLTIKIQLKSRMVQQNRKFQYL